MNRIMVVAALFLVGAGAIHAQVVPAGATRVTAAKGPPCDAGYLERGSKCVRMADATDAEIRRAIIAASIAAYSGSCPCPFNTDRAGRRCGGRSAYSRPGGRSPLCYPTDVSDATVRAFRDRYKATPSTP